MNNSTIMSVKTILLKFGNKCNLKCKYCHQSEHSYRFNDDILEYLYSLPTLESVTFSGGEPFLYKNEIQKCIDAILKNSNRPVKLKILTNGTLLTDENIDWINEYGIFLGISFDGYNNMRGTIPQFNKISKIKRFSGISTVVTNQFDYNSFYEEILQIMKDTNKNLIGSTPNFIHQTYYAPNYDLVDEETIDRYIAFICDELTAEKSRCGTFTPFVNSLKRRYLNGLNTGRGMLCCCETHLHMTTEGDFLLCGYGDTKVGDIYKGIDIDFINSLIPDKCRNCSYWNVCKCTCLANITDNECRIFRAVYDHYTNLFGTME